MAPSIPVKVPPRAQRALTALGFFGFGALLTYAAMQLANRSEAFGDVMLLLWAAVAFGGTQILPEAITRPYDPVGHPALWALAFLVNAVLFALLVFGLWALAKWAGKRYFERVT